MTLACPDVAFCKPARILSNVDLPHPDGPSTATNSPSAISTSKSFSAFRSPRAIASATGLYGTRRKLEPTVIALDQIDPSLLLRPDRPYLATLAVAGHAKAPDAQPVADAAVDLTLDRLPKHLAAEQLDAILGMVDDALRAHLERRIMEHREYRSEFFRNIYNKGAAEGEAKGKAAALLTVLTARGLAVDEATQARIDACLDVEQLDRWLARALTAGSAREAVDE